MAAYTKFEHFSEDLVKGVHNFSTATFKVALSNVAPVASTGAVLADITQITAANGYTSGGTAVATVTFSRSGGVSKIVFTNVTFTASGGAMAAFRYIVFYNSTASGGPLIGFADYGSALTLANTDTFTVSFDATNGFGTFS